METAEATGTALKVLLKQQHLQEHGAFKRAYDRAAGQVDKDLVGTAPSKATFYRWLAGGLVKLPYPGACRVLEQMLPGWSAAELFSDWNDVDGPAKLRPDDGAEREAAELPQVVQRDDRFADLSAVFTSRSEFSHELPPSVLFDGATSIRAAGLSLNMICQQYGDRGLRDLLRAGCTMHLLFLRPYGEAIRQREREENYPDGFLSGLTELNISIIERLREMVDDHAERLVIRTYDETIRFNITLVNDRTCVMQPYLPDARGLDAPTMVADRSNDVTGFYDIFANVFETLWERADVR